MTRRSARIARLTDAWRRFGPRRSARRPARALVAVVAAVAAMTVVGAGVAPQAAHAATGSTIVNFTPSGQQVMRFDTNGNAVDAHDGQIAEFGGTYYLYGTSYNCGYRWGINSDFCGFKVYSSSDLSHWTDRGFVVPAYSCADCFRPHVLYDAATRSYVLWTNDSSAPGDFRVYTSASPTGPFTERTPPTLAYSDCGWDFGLFQDTNGQAYMVNTDCADSDDGLVIQQLTADDLTSDGTYAVAHMPGAVEAPSMFERDGRYYITMSDPTCGYCTNTGTGYLTASNPLGPWTGSSQTDTWNVENGQLHVTGGSLGGAIGLAATGTSWTDYDLAFDTTPLETGTAGSGPYAQAGWVIRMDAAGNGYGFLLSNYPYTDAKSSGYLAFVKYSNGNATTVTPTALPFAVVAGQSYHVVSSVSGDTLTVAINGTTVDTVTDSSYTAGTVGFREDGADSESADFDNVAVTAPDGSTLFSDDFSGGLSQWNAPAPAQNPYLISQDSCGGQPSFVSELPKAGGGDIYLYGSDLWDAQRNEGVSNYFWAPLRFDGKGAIGQIACSPEVSLDLAHGHPGSQAPVPGRDQTSGVAGFQVACDIAGGTERMQTFTTGRSGTLRQVRLTAYQETTPAVVTGAANTLGSPVDAPLTLRLVTLDGQGGIARVLATQTYAIGDVGWSATNLTLSTDTPVKRGQTYAVVASSSATQGCYGIAQNTANPYRGGHAATSTDGGQTFTAAPTTDLKFLTVG